MQTVSLHYFGLRWQKESLGVIQKLRHQGRGEVGTEN